MSCSKAVMLPELVEMTELLMLAAVSEMAKLTDVYQTAKNNKSCSGGDNSSAWVNSAVNAGWAGKKH